MHSVFEMKGSNGQLVKGNKWIVSEEVKQVVVLSHGMNEYTYRYNDFALYIFSYLLGTSTILIFLYIILDKKRY